MDFDDLIAELAPPPNRQGKARDGHEQRFYEGAVVNPKSGLGDVVARTGDTVISAECKGGIINSRHAGAVSKLYRGLC